MTSSLHVSSVCGAIPGKPYHTDHPVQGRLLNPHASWRGNRHLLLLIIGTEYTFQTQDTNYINRSFINKYDYLNAHQLFFIYPPRL